MQGATSYLGMKTRLGAQTALTGTGQLIHEPETGVMPILVVFWTGVTQSDDELYLCQTDPGLFALGLRLGVGGSHRCLGLGGLVDNLLDTRMRNRDHRLIDLVTLVLVQVLEVVQFN